MSGALEAFRSALKGKRVKDARAVTEQRGKAEAAMPVDGAAITLRKGMEGAANITMQGTRNALASARSFRKALGVKSGRTAQREEVLTDAEQAEFDRLHPGKK